MESLGVVGGVVLLTGEDSVMMQDLLASIFGGGVKSDYCKLSGRLCKKSANRGMRSTKARLLCKN